MAKMLGVPICRPAISRLFIFLIIFILTTALPAAAESVSGQLDTLSRFSGPQNALVITDHCNNLIYAENPDKLLIPASALKVFTALMAISYLGPDFRFVTEFYADAENNVKIKGYGDPLLVSEAVDNICARLAGHRENIRDLVLDSTYFDGAMRVPGCLSGSLQPYDAPNGALCVNFNTIYFSSVNGLPVSAEPQTPLLPLAIKRIGETKTPSGRILLAGGDGDAVQYAGELFFYFFEKRGITVTGDIRCGTVSEQEDRLIYRYESEYPLTEIVRRLLKYSNNFMANQLFLAVGAHVFGAPASLDKSVRAAGRFAESLGLKGMIIVEGSGISRQNRMSARMFMPILQAFAPYHDLMTKEDRLYFKTGTLNGITTRVGYVQADPGDLMPFAVIINDPKKNAADAMRKIRHIELKSAPCPSPGETLH